MPHGLPDYGLTTGKEDIHASLDMGEMAVRLGAVSRYDRLGDVVFVEDFEEDLAAWEKETSGAGASVDVVATRKVTGGFSCKMTAGSDGDRYAGIVGRLPVPYSSIYGFEWAWTLDENMDYGYVEVSVYTGTYLIKSGFKYDPSAQAASYLNALDGWTALSPGARPLFSDRFFVVFKFTIDISTVKYSRILAPPASWSASGESGYIVGDTTQPHMLLRGRIYSKLGENAVCYSDSYIVTANDV